MPFPLPHPLPHRRSGARQREAGFLLPLAASGGLVLLLSSLSLQAMALQQRQRLAAEWQSRARTDRFDGSARRLAARLAAELRASGNPPPDPPLSQRIAGEAAPLHLTALALAAGTGGTLVARLSLADPAGGAQRHYQLELESSTGRILGLMGTGR